MNEKLLFEFQDAVKRFNNIAVVIGDTKEIETNIGGYLLDHLDIQYRDVKKAATNYLNTLMGKGDISSLKVLNDGGKISDYKSEISFEQALDELHDAAHEHEKNPSRATKRRLNEAEKNLAKAKMDFAIGDVCNIRDGRKGIDANPEKWKKYWNTLTRGKAHKKSAIVKALKKAHVKITNPIAFAKALEERFG